MTADRRFHRAAMQWPESLLLALRSGRLRVACLPLPLRGLTFLQLRRQLERLSPAQCAALVSAWATGVGTAPGNPAASELQGLDPAVTDARARGLPRQEEAVLLQATVRDRYGRRHWLQPAARRAFAQLHDAARADGVELEIISSFRSVGDQCRILKRKLRHGHDWSLILQVSAAPGYSEHHTGCAIDLSTPGQSPLVEEFERTPAFAWLCRHADRFGFRMSYPRDNSWGFIYEPWHWCFHLEAAQLRTTGP